MSRKLLLLFPAQCDYMGRQFSDEQYILFSHEDEKVAILLRLFHVKIIIFLEKSNFVSFCSGFDFAFILKLRFDGVAEFPKTKDGFQRMIKNEMGSFCDIRKAILTFLNIPATLPVIKGKIRYQILWVQIFIHQNENDPFKLC